MLPTSFYGGGWVSAQTTLTLPQSFIRRDVDSAGLFGPVEPGGRRELALELAIEQSDKVPPWGEGGPVFGWGVPARSGVWAIGVVVSQPISQGDTGIGQAREQGFIEHLVPEPTIERCNERVLHRLSRSDVMPVNLVPIGEPQDGIRGQLGAVVSDHHLRPAPCRHERL